MTDERKTPLLCDKLIRLRGARLRVGDKGDVGFSRRGELDLLDLRKR